MNREALAAKVATEIHSIQKAVKVAAVAGEVTAMLLEELITPLAPAVMEVKVV